MPIMLRDDAEAENHKHDDRPKAQYFKDALSALSIPCHLLASPPARAGL